LFLEEERERELEELYDRGIVDNMNHEDVQGPAGEQGAEVTSVNKQTGETLMAGEKIMEALDIADADRASMKEYEEAKSKLSEADLAQLPLPTKNPVLAAYDIDGPAYVLRTVEKIQGTALHDALLVLPFTKVISLMFYLNEWAIRVSSSP